MESNEGPAQEDIELVTFAAGDYLFYENETSFHFFIVQEGEVEIFKTAQGGAKIPLAILGPGNSIGEFAMIDRSPRSATARTLTEVHAAKISEQGYQRLIAELPDWAVTVMRALVERLRQTNEIIRKGRLVDPQMLMRIDAVQFDDTAIKAGGSSFPGSSQGKGETETN